MRSGQLWRVSSRLALCRLGPYASKQQKAKNNRE
jgi:hypothetical protein